MIEVVINGKDLDVNRVISIVNELREKGYRQGVDFDFEYHPPKYIDWGGDDEYDRYVLFKFYKEELATYFRLMYE